VRHYIDAECRCPCILGAVEAHANGGTGVREVDVDIAKVGAGSGDECLDPLLARGIPWDCERANISGGLAGLRFVKVVDDDTGTLLGQLRGNGKPNAPSGSGDDDALITNIKGPHGHRPPVSVSPPSMTIVWPVIHAASAERRKATTDPMSCGSPSLFSG
jgi:hypothetical protein